MIRAPLPIEDGSTALIWARYLGSRSPADLNLLVAKYAPLVGATVGAAIKSSPDLFAFRGGDAISDGFIGLISEIEKARRYDADAFPAFAVVAIRQAIWHSRRDQEFGGRQRSYEFRRIEHEREAFYSVNGRPPTDEELRESLQRKYPRALRLRAAFNAGETRMMATSELNIENVRSLHRAVDRSLDDPSLAAAFEDIKALAERGLSRIERKVLHLLLSGASVAETCRRLKISQYKMKPIERRVRWQLRSRPELAAALGVQASRLPDEIRPGHFPPFDNTPSPLAA